jgi:transcriptional regulator with XRE-family HTH domain
MDISERLKFERQRLGYTQTAFALLGGSTKQTLINWEAGRQTPNAEFLAAIAKAGADILFIVTGATVAPIESTLDRKGQAMVDNYINSPEEGRRFIESTALFATKQVVRKTGT